MCERRVWLSNLLKPNLWSSCTQNKEKIWCCIRSRRIISPEVKNKQQTSPPFISHSESSDLVIFTVPVKQFTALSFLVTVPVRVPIYYHVHLRAHEKFIRFICLQEHTTTGQMSLLKALFRILYFTWEKGESDVHGLMFPVVSGLKWRF